MLVRLALRRLTLNGLTLNGLALAVAAGWMPASAIASSVSLEWGNSSGEPAIVPYAEPLTGDDLWQRIRAGFRIADEPHPLIAQHEAWYAARPEHVSRVVERARRYLFHIVKELEARSMPTELALLPIVESAFNPTAYSPSDASGIWQFIPSTGKHYGLKQDAWYDGRRDFPAATRAALDYLGKLYLDFGDWRLALAAYNCGEGCVARAIQKNAAQGLPTDYASLTLPAETRNYVPRLLAVKHLIADPARFKLSLGEMPNTPYFESVELPPGLSLDIPAAARLADMSAEEFSALNAAHSQGVIRSDTPVSVLLPVGRRDHFQRRLADGDWDQWQPYNASRGERIADIAERHATSVARLELHNQLKLKQGRLAQDQTILVPLSARAGAGALVPKPALRPVAYAPTGMASARHTVARGESLFAIARQYGVSLGALQNANPDASARLAPGQTLNLPAGTGSPPASPAREHVVERGDTLYGIAARYQVSLAELRDWNQQLDSRTALQPGDKITLRP